MGEEEDWSWCV